MCCVAGAWRLMVLCEGGGGKGWDGEREVATIRDTGDLTVFISPLYLFCGKFLGRCYVSWCRVRYYCWGLNFSMTGGSVYLSALIGSDASLLSLIHQTLIYQSANQSPVFRAWGLQTLHNILSYSWRSLTNLKTGRWFAAPLCPGQGSCNTIQTCIAQRQPVENQSRAISSLWESNITIFQLAVLVITKFFLKPCFPAVALLPGWPGCVMNCCVHCDDKWLGLRSNSCNHPLGITQCRHCPTRYMGLAREKEGLCLSVG